MAEEWDHLEEWEEWDPSKGSFLVHAAAGSFAGAAEHCFMFPFDTIKTHLQTEGAGRTQLQKLIHVEGVSRLWRGVSTMLYACIPAHAAYFSIYEHGKTMFGANNEQHTPIQAGMAGVFATLAHDSIMTPMDVIKQRLQLGFHTGITDCASAVVRNEGLGALFISFPTTVMMNVPYAAVMVATNESIKKIVNPSNEYNLPAFFFSGGIAGAVAAAITNPLDVAKTRLQTQLVFCESCEHAPTPPKNGAFAPPQSGTGRGGGHKGLFINGGAKLSEPAIMITKESQRFAQTDAKPCPRRYNGLADALKRIYKDEGLRGFQKGIRPRLMVHAPSVAISWTTYETAKEMLGKWLE